MAVMAAMSIAFGDRVSMAGFTAGLIVSGAIALAIHLAVAPDETIELKHAMVIAALAYLLVPALSAIPYVYHGVPPIDAFFEGISGWTGSGFTMIPSPETAAHTIQLWRSLTQWVGGAGVILLMVTILIRPGTSAFTLYTSEARKERIKPSIRSTLNIIWKLYLGLTLFAVLLLLAAGMPAWDALNTAMTAISKGGFSIYADSIGHYGSLSVELALIPIMVAGSLPFAAMYRALKPDPRALLDDVQVRAFIGLVIAGCAVLAIQNMLFPVGASVADSVFQFASAVTCTGLQSADLSRWSPTSMLILSIAMVIGGCAGSTSGGIKIARALFLVAEARLWLAQTLLTKKAVIVVRMGDRKLTGQEMSRELADAALISFLWVVTMLASIMLLSNIVLGQASLSQVIFEVCSAMGNVGLTAGIVSPGMSLAAKLIIMFDMWVGRLEIIPVLVLLRAILKGLRP